jgi:hypothetical protein
MVKESEAKSPWPKGNYMDTFRRVIIFVLVFCGGAAGAGVAASPSSPNVPPPEVPVRSVVLFSSGVGYFEHAGPITGDATTELRFKANQINDILKSLVLEDRVGRVSAVVYPSQDPLSKTLRSFQVNITGNPTLAELLRQLRGAKVAVTAQAELIAGTILGVERKQKAVNEKSPVVEVWVVNLIAGGSIRAVPLDDVQKIELEDKQLQEELNQALLALAQARDQDKKPVSFKFRGDGERQVKLGYVVETPIWKTSYRLILPTADEKPRLQGWAIVENQTDSDWNNIELSLVSGRPISFIQELYQPLYMPRPVVQPELFASLRPQTYDAGLDKDQPAERFAENEEKQRQMDALKRAPSRASKSLGRLKRDEPYAEGSQEESVAGSPPSRGIDATAGIASVASAGTIGELFQYSIVNVSLPRQRSAMLPIVTDEIEAERVSIYNKSVLPRNPLYGARIKNTTGKHLLQGPLTVLDDRSYAGDAQIDNLPPGQERFISYGIDLETQVNATNRRQDNTIQTGRLVKGVLHVTRKHVVTQEYVVENKSQKAKDVVVEHAFQSGWKLVETPKPMETTDSLYRFRDSIPAGKTRTLTVKEELVQGETIAILPADLGQLESYSRSGEIPAVVREALIKTMRLKSAVLDSQRQIQQRQKEVSDISQEQKRIRDNMNTVTQSSQYYARLLGKLNDQESRIEKLQVEIERLQQTHDQQRKELETYLLNTTVG